MSLPRAERWAYAAPAVPLALVGIPLFVFLPKFYTDVVGVDIAVLGAWILAVRLFDAVSDPWIGSLSDRTRSRMGRRRPWIALGVWPLALSIVCLFAPPSAPTDVAALWFGGFMLTTFLFWTVVTVPYESLAPELTSDYDERTGLLALRDGALLLGILLGAVSPLVVGAMLSEGEGSAFERAKFRWLGAVYAPALLALCGWCVWRVRERMGAKRAAGKLTLRAARSLLANRPFRILLASYTVSAVGSNLPATLIPFYVQYVLGAEGAEVFLLVYFGVGIATLPFWVWIARRREKKAAWLAAMAVNTGAFLGVFFLGEGDLAAYGVLVTLSGLGFGATIALPSAMQADVIDYDELRESQRREGQVIGLWAVSRKLAASLGAGLAFPILGWVGYQANAPQTPEVKLALRTLYALVPCLCNAVGWAIALRYPIDRATHQRILAALDERRGGRDAPDPLATAAR